MKNGVSEELRDLAQKLTDLHEKAREFGLFIDDRELLTCTSCGLMEDVTADGRLITHYGEFPNVVDTGLRFNELPDERFSCPRCGTEMIADDRLL